MVDFTNPEAYTWYKNGKIYSLFVYNYHWINAQYVLPKIYHYLQQHEKTCPSKYCSIWKRIHTSSTNFCLRELTKVRHDWLTLSCLDVIKKNIIGLGFGGWMADFGEYLPVDAVLSNGQSPRSVHNLWPRIWAQLNREAVEEMGEAGADIVFFSRSGFSGKNEWIVLPFYSKYGRIWIIRCNDCRPSSGNNWKNSKNS